MRRRLFVTTVALLTLSAGALAAPAAAPSRKPTFATMYTSRTDRVTGSRVCLLQQPVRVKAVGALNRHPFVELSPLVIVTIEGDSLLRLSLDVVSEKSGAYTGRLLVLLDDSTRFAIPPDHREATRARTVSVNAGIVREEVFVDLSRDDIHRLGAASRIEIRVLGDVCNTDVQLGQRGVLAFRTLLDQLVRASADSVAAHPERLLNVDTAKER